MDPIITTPSPTEGSAPVVTDGEPEPTGATVEERDAYWQKRMSGKDRAHAAAEKALREELESLRKAQATSGANGQSGNGADPNAAEVERLKRELAARDTLYGRKAKYPNLNGNVSDATIMSSDEADLAKFNALFDNASDGGTFIAPTAPKRTAAPTAKPIEQMTKDELLVELDRETRRMQEDRG
jgi:hypothetical protein